MRMNRRVLALVLLGCVLAAGIAGADTLLLGAKLWPAFWSAYIVEAYADAAAPLEVVEYAGYGGVLGPVLGYQPEGARWSVSLAAMVLNYFYQEMDLYDGFGGWLDTIYLDNSRMEFDVAFNYQVSELVKVFAGYKLQLTSMIVSSDFGGAFEITTRMHMPTAGIGVAYPISDTLVLGGQLGVLYAIPYAEVDGIQDETFESTVGFTGEATVSVLKRQGMIVQVGYRFQQVGVAFDLDGLPGAENYKDTFHGLTLAVIYLLDV